MRIPPRSSKTISSPALPSILTLFPENHEHATGQISADQRSEDGIADGIEMVPIERSNTSCLKIVSPGTEEKEVVMATPLPQCVLAKPLPALPKTGFLWNVTSRWYRLSVKQRVLILLGIQLSLLLIICLSLLAIEPHTTQRNANEPPIGPIASTRVLVSHYTSKGAFSLALDTPRWQSSACLPNGDESAAWSCTNNAILQIVINSPEPQSADISLTLEHIQPTKNTYGQQPPSIRATTLDLTLVPEHHQGKPTYRFRSTYNRTVLLAADRLSFQHAVTSEAREILLPNNRPWLCYFRDTIIEGLIHSTPHTTTATNSTNSTNSNVTDTIQLPRFPYTLELSEQWSMNNTRAYCEQQTVLNTGERTKTSTTKYFLSTTQASDLLDTRPIKKRRNSSQNACRCEWTAQARG